MQTRICTKCKEELPFTNKYFCICNANKSGLTARCKKCISLHKQEYYKKNKDYIQERNRKWRDTYPEKLQECSRKKFLRDKYGLSIEEYDIIYQEQGGICAICGQEETKISNSGGRIQRLSIDHNHVTGEIRGLLCHNCNILLGVSGENPQVLSEAIKYLEKFIDKEI